MQRYDIIKKLHGAGLELTESLATDGSNYIFRVRITPAASCVPRRSKPSTGRCQRRQRCSSKLQKRWGRFSRPSCATPRMTHKKVWHRCLPQTCYLAPLCLLAVWCGVVWCGVWCVLLLFLMCRVGLWPGFAPFCRENKEKYEMYTLGYFKPVERQTLMRCQTRLCSSR